MTQIQKQLQSIQHQQGTTKKYNFHITSKMGIETKYLVTNNSNYKNAVKGRTYVDINSSIDSSKK